MLHGSRTTRCNDRNVYRVRYPAGYIQCKPVFRSVMIHGCEQYLTGPKDSACLTQSVVFMGLVTFSLREYKPASAGFTFCIYGQHHTLTPEFPGNFAD